MRDVILDTDMTRPLGPAHRATLAWQLRAKDPQAAISHARAALHERPGGAVSALALAAIAVASAALNDADEAFAAAQHVPQLMAEGGVTELFDMPEVLIEANLACLKSAFLKEDLGAGIRAGQHALELAGMHGRRALQARAHTELGALYGSHGLTKSALEHLQGALAVLENHDLPVPPSLHNNLGNIYLNRDRPQEALGYFTRAREEFVAQDDMFRASQARSNEGRALLALDRVPEAVEAFEEGVAWQEKLTNSSYYAAALSKSAIGYARAGYVSRAEARFTQALAAIEALGQADPFEEEIRGNYGNFLMEQGRFEEALGQYERALERTRAATKVSRVAALLERKARALAGLRRFEEAYKAVREHMEMSEQLEDEASDLLLRLQLLELESTVSGDSEMHAVARQAMLDANRELRERTRYLEDLSVTDDLTGLFNRRYFRLRVVEEEARAQRQGHDMALMVIDVDHFKAVNDSHSHAIGDKVLREVAAQLQHAFRETDVVARWGGEEFAVLLTGFNGYGASVIAERARESIENHDWASYGEGLALTVSIGIASLNEVVPLAPRGAAGGHNEALFDLADARLYKAKSLGRNRAVFSSAD